MSEQDQSGGTVNDQPEQVSKEVEGYKTDMFKFKEKAKTLEAENLELKKLIEQSNLKSLEEKEDFKRLYEMQKEKAESLEQENKSFINSFVESKRLDAIRTEALKFGIKEEALNDLDLIDKSAVVVEKTDRGTVNVIGAKDFVDSLKRARPFWFNDGTPPTVNSAPPGNKIQEAKKLTPKEIIDLQKTNPEAYSKYVLTHKGRL